MVTEGAYAPEQNPAYRATHPPAACHHAHVMASLIAALVAAIAYGAGTVLQAQSVRTMRALPAGVTRVQRIRAGWGYGLGLLVDGLGFLAALVAFRRLPLFLVESAIASSVAVTAVLSVLLLGIRLHRNERIAVVAVAVGLAMLGAAAQDGRAISVDGRAGWTLLASTVFVALALAWGKLDAQRHRAAIVLSIAAGLGFGILGIAARLLVVPDHWWLLVRDPVLWSLLLGGGIAIVAYGVALDRGRVTTVAAITFAVETVLPAIVGLAWLGDAVRAGLAPMAILGFAATLGGCLTLAGRAEPHA